jgi:hypothetical protein
VSLEERLQQSAVAAHQHTISKPFVEGGSALHPEFILYQFFIACLISIYESYKGVSL